MGGEICILTSEKEKYLVKEAEQVLLLPEVEECFANFVYAIPLQLFGYFLSQEQEKEARIRLGKQEY